MVGMQTLVSPCPLPGDARHLLTCAPQHSKNILHRCIHNRVYRLLATYPLYHTSTRHADAICFPYQTDVLSCADGVPPYREY